MNRESMIGENNPMYGHSIKEFMSDSDFSNWKTNMGNGHKGIKRPDASERMRNNSYVKGKHWKQDNITKQKHKNLLKIVSNEYKEYKTNGGTMNWNEFQRKFSRNK